jgi:hypothetical protein
MAFVGPRKFVQTTSIELSSAFQHKINQAFQKELHAQAKSMAALSATAAQKGQVEAIRVVREKLIGGITPLTGGNKSISYTSFGKGRRLNVPTSWNMLSDRYANSNPVSHAFWMKHEGVTNYRQGKTRRTTLAAAFNVAALGAAGKAKSSQIRNVTGKSKQYYTFVWDIELDTPHNVLSELITTPLAEGLIGSPYDHAWQYDGAISKGNVSFIVWVEGARPFIRRLSWKIGRDLRTEVTKILTARRAATNAAVAAGAGKLGRTAQIGFGSSYDR